MILVTGAFGYLGKHVHQCLARGLVDAVSVGSTWDLTDDRTVGEMLRAVAPERVIHLAAKVPKTRADYNDPVAAAESYAMAANLAERATCPITFASSMTAGHATTEYAYAKLQAERIIDERKNPEDRIIRLPGLFGAPRASGVLYNAARAFLTGQPFVLENVPERWAAMDVRDAAECMVTGEYTGPTEPYDLRAAVSLVGVCCGVEWGQWPIAFPTRTLFERIAELVEWVRSTLPAEVA